MPVSIEEIVKHHDFAPGSMERVAHRKTPMRPEIVEPNPLWPQRFAEVKERVAAALGSKALAIHHVGSTSIPNLPAKDLIDVDLVVQDSVDEASYVGALEKAGFLLIFRQPDWHQHRLFVDDWDNSYPVLVHVWSPHCPEVERHHILRAWLLKTPADFQLYVNVKRECAAASAAAGESTMDYNLRKEGTIREILARAFRDLGYIK